MDFHSLVFCSIIVCCKGIHQIGVFGWARDGCVGKGHLIGQGKNLEISTVFVILALATRGFSLSFAILT